MPAQDCRKIEVLLVEDNEDDVLIATRVLQNSGVPVRLRVVRDGEEALRLLCSGRHNGGQRASPDLVVLDLSLPRVDGFEVLRRLRSQDQLPSMPVVVLTGSAGEQQVRQCMELGSKLYIIKPLGIADVMNCWFGLRRHWSGGAEATGPSCEDAREVLGMPTKGADRSA